MGKAVANWKFRDRTTRSVLNDYRIILLPLSGRYNQLCQPVRKHATVRHVISLLLEDHLSVFPDPSVTAKRTDPILSWQRSFFGFAPSGFRFARVARNLSSPRPSSPSPQSPYTATFQPPPPFILPSSSCPPLPPPFCTFFVSHSRFTYRTGNEISCPVLNLVTVMYCPSSDGSSWEMIKRNKRPCAIESHAMLWPVMQRKNQRGRRCATQRAESYSYRSSEIAWSRNYAFH